MRMKCCLHYNQWNGTSSKNTFLSKIAQVQRRYKQGFRKKIWNEMTLQASKKLNVKGRINFCKTCYCIMEEFPWLAHQGQHTAHCRSWRLVILLAESEGLCRSSLFVKDVTAEICSLLWTLSLVLFFFCIVSAHEKLDLHSTAHLEGLMEVLYLWQRDLKN